MSYRVVLQGKETIILSDEQAEKLSEIWKSKTLDTITLGKNTIAVNSIKGIFPIERADTTKQDEGWKRQNAEWHQECLTKSQLPVDDKIETELTVRIDGAFKLATGKIVDRQSTLYAQLHQLLVDFFVNNPKYPRCPMGVWYPTIRPYMLGQKPMLTRFFEYVSRNDFEIDKWAKFNGIHLLLSYQKQLASS